MELVGWAEPPQYDATNKKLFWAKELAFGDAPEHTLNYDMRILGRRGVLILRAVAGMDQLAQIKDARSQILGMVNYNQGHRYADFNPKTDKVAAYGVAALVLGGIAAKAGFFKLLIPVLLVAKKFVIIGVVAVVRLLQADLRSRREGAVKSSLASDDRSLKTSVILSGATKEAAKAES